MNQISLAEYVQQIERSIESGHYNEAVAHGKHILEQYPKYLRAYWMLGKAMLEAGRHEHAADMFQRVLSADPEQMLAWVGMSEIAERRGELEAAVWYLERAFELATDNEVVANQLRHLQGKLEGREPERLQLTQGALARLYLRGDLLSRAITELRKLLEEHPDRVDLKVALAEALWRSGKRAQASEVCQEILDQQPYNLKANLILGEVWSDSGREEGEFYLARAEEIDPENRVAQELLGAASPLPSEDPQITPAEYEPTVLEERPARITEAEETPLLEPDELMATTIEIPLWLQEMAEEGVPGDSEELAVSERETMEEEPPVPAEPALEDVERLEELAPEDLDEDEGLEWLTGLEEEEVARSEPDEEVLRAEGDEEMPAWLADVDVEPTKEEAAFEAGALEEPEEAEEPERAEIPDWLRDLAPAEFEPRGVPSPEALAALLDEGLPADETPPTEETEAVTDLPPWLDEEEIPAADDAMAWLDELTEEEEAEIRAQVEAEAEERAPEIVERPELTPEEAAEELEEPVEHREGEEPLAEAEELMEVDEAAALEEAEAVSGLPAWFESEDIPTGDDALTWLEDLVEDKEAELRLRAEAEGEVPVDEVPGRPELSYEQAVEELEEPAEAPATEEPKVEEVAPEEAPGLAEEEAPVEELEPTFPEEEVEEPLEAPAEEEAFVWAAPDEEAPPMEEVEEAEAVAPAPEAPAEEEVEAPPEEGVPAEEAEALPEEAFGWTAFGEREEAAVEAEEVQPEVEAVPTEEPEPMVAEEPAAEPTVAEEVELARVEEPVPAVEEQEPEDLEAPVDREVIAVEEEEMAPSLAMEEAPPEDVDQFVAEQRARVEEHPEDGEARLELGRLLWQAGQRAEAIKAYDHLIERGELLDEIIPDLEDYEERWPDPSVRQALGDAYVRADRLQDALKVYREALASL